MLHRHPYPLKLPLFLRNHHLMGKSITANHFGQFRRQQEAFLRTERLQRQEVAHSYEIFNFAINIFFVHSALIVAVGAVFVVIFSRKPAPLVQEITPHVRLVEACKPLTEYR